MNTTFKNFFKLSIIASAISLVSTTVKAQDLQEIYNPNPSKDDVIVSMPCNGFMVFKKIYTTTGGKKKVEDKSFKSGISENASAFAMNENTRFVQGSFKDNNGYYYLISKYELMQAQYDILKDTSNLKDNSKCKTPNKMDRKSAVNISYFDVINATRNYSLYLQTAKDAPKQGDEIAIARLPSEEEWEFAARGGYKVSDSIREAKVPVEDDISDYAWHEGNQSANGTLKLTGLKKPTPGDLYDILGNAQEMVLEPFKAVRTGRLLGQSGGLCVRGGGFRTNKDALTTADRTEKPLFVKGKENKAGDIGARLVLGVSVAPSKADLKSINEEVKKLGDVPDDENVQNALKTATAKINEISLKNQKEQEQLNAEKDKLLSKNKDLSEEKDNLEDSLKKSKEINQDLVGLNEKLSKSNDDLNKQLTSLKGEVEKANDERTQMRNVAVTSNIRLGGFLCKSIADESFALGILEKTIKVFKEDCEENKSKCVVYKEKVKNLDSHKLALRNIATYYGDTISNANSNYTEREFKDQTKEAKLAFGSKNNFSDYIDLYLNHLKAYKKGTRDLNKNIAQWKSDCTSISIMLNQKKTK